MQTETTETVAKNHTRIDLPLIIGIHRDNFQIHTAEFEKNSEYQKNQLAAIIRDNNECLCCGFVSSEPSHFNVHHINQNHTDHSLGNLATVCPFCHAVFHAGCVTQHQTMRLIFCPWLTQAEINLQANLLVSILAFNQNSKFIDTAENLYYEFESLRSYLRFFEIDDISSGVLNLSSALLSLSYKNPQAYERRAELLAGLRFWPDIDAFIEIAKQWKKEWVPESQWEQIKSSILPIQVNSDCTNQANSQSAESSESSDDNDSEPSQIKSTDSNFEVGEDI